MKITFENITPPTEDTAKIDKWLRDKLPTEDTAKIDKWLRDKLPTLVGWNYSQITKELELDFGEDTVPASLGVSEIHLGKAAKRIRFLGQEIERENISIAKT